MSAYRQILRVGDYQGDVVWEMVISAEYSKCFAGAEPVQDVDIFNIESIKYEGETLTLQQKDDEFQFSMQEYNATTQADNDAIALMKSAEYSDVWVAIFEHEPEETSPTPSEGGELVGSMSFERMVFSGLVRRKASAEDVLWTDDTLWGANPNPLRSWKFSAQAFGSAVMDTVNLASKKVDNTVIAGVLDQISVFEMNPLLGRWGKATGGMGGDVESQTSFSGAVWLSEVLIAILNKTQLRLQEKLPGFEIEAVPSQTAYSYAVQVSADEVSDNSTARKYPLLDSDFSGFMIDKRLIKPRMKDDAITPDTDYGMAWHRFDSVTDLLYNLSVCFGTQLRIESKGSNKISVCFDPVLSGTRKQVSVIDAVKADLDIQSVKPSDNDKYSCQGTDMCSDGYAICYYTPGDEYVSVKNDAYKPTASNNSLPLSVSMTIQMIVSDVAPLPQNTDWTAAGAYGLKDQSTHKMAWTGMLGKRDSNNIGIVRQVAATIDGKAYWYEKLSDLLNAKISANGEYYKAEYKLELPYIKSFRTTTPNPSEGGESTASLKNLELFDKIILDSKEYIITSIEIKPTDGTVSIKMSRSSRYGFAEPSEPIFGKITVPAQGDIYDNYRPATSETAGERIENNSLVRRGVDGKIYNYLNTEANYGSYLGVSVISADEGDAVMYRTAGESYSANELIIAKPVYARTIDGKAVVSSLRLNGRTETEQSDIRIGFAKTANTWQMQLGNEFIIE